MACDTSRPGMSWIGSDNPTTLQGVHDVCDGVGILRICDEQVVPQLLPPTPHRTHIGRVLNSFKGDLA